MNDVIALGVLVLVFLVATVRSINMGALALVAAAVVGRHRLRRRPGRGRRRLPGHPLRHPRRGHLPLRPRQEQRHGRLDGPCERAGRPRPGGARALGDVRHLRRHRRHRRRHPRDRRHRRAGRHGLRRPLPDQPGPHGHGDHPRARPVAPSRRSASSAPSPTASSTTTTCPATRPCSSRCRSSRASSSPPSPSSSSVVAS